MSVTGELREHITAHLSAALPEDGGWRTLPAPDLVNILAGAVMSAVSPALADLSMVQDALTVIADAASLPIPDVGDAITDEVTSVLAIGPQHNHETWNLQPYGECPACDSYHNYRAAEEDAQEEAVAATLWAGVQEAGQ